MKAAFDYRKTNECSCVTLKFYGHVNLNFKTKRSQNRIAGFSQKLMLRVASIRHHNSWNPGILQDSFVRHTLYFVQTIWMLCNEVRRSLFAFCYKICSVVWYLMDTHCLLTGPISTCFESWIKRGQTKAEISREHKKGFFGRLFIEV